MGAAYSCTSKGSLLLVAAANGDLVSAQEVRRVHHCESGDLQAKRG